MAGKKNTEKEGSSWIGKVEDYSRKIWLAGLGVYSKIDTDGSKLFDTLVKDGEKAEKQCTRRYVLVSSSPLEFVNEMFCVRASAISSVRHS